MSGTPLQFLILTVASWLNRRQERVIEYLQEENRVLREQLGAKRLRLTNAQRAGLARKGKALGRKQLGAFQTIVTPDTILRWYRQFVARKYDGSARRGPGRPRKPREVVELVLSMARKNPGWGYTRLRGALRNLQLDAGRNTIKRILIAHGLEPAPERSQRSDWSTFLRAHWGAIAAADFFTVEVLTLGGLVRYHVLFVIDLASRRVEVCGISAQVEGFWMKQMARRLTDAIDGFLLHSRYLIIDRDPLFTSEFRAILRSGGVETVRLPARSPNLNAYAERFVRSIRQECLSKVVPLGHAHLRALVREYVEHYHQERNHQGLENRLLRPEPELPATGPVRRRERLGGLLSYYYREAA